MPAPLLDEWAHTMAALHRATPMLADVLPPRETFDIPFEAELRHGIAALEQIKFSARPGLLALREVVLPRRADMFAQLARLHRLQSTVRRLPGPFVLCHTDMGGDNLLIHHDGKLLVLDWDDATVAPPEHDLHEARWQNMARVVDVYAAGGAHPLHLDHFAFYLLRRHLGDMTARFLRMLAQNTTPDDDADALHGIEAWGFAQWARLDKTLDGIAAALGHRHL
jgi:aminoglycoside phosphotransferase (APT) family kinase protein